MNFIVFLFMLSLLAIPFSWIRILYKCIRYFEEYKLADFILDFCFSFIPIWNVIWLLLRSC